MYKIMNNKAPGYIIDLFQKSSSRNYSLRESENRLLLPKYNTEFAKSSCFSFVGAKVWNSIPYNIRSATSLSVLLNGISTVSLLCNCN